MRVRFHNSLFVLILLCASAAWADDAPSTAEPRKFYGSVALGGYSENSNDQFSNAQGKFAGYLGFGWRMRPNLSLEVELTGYYQDIDAPSSYRPSNGTLDDRATVSVVGLVPQVKYIFPVNNVDWFVGGGIGLYSATATVTGSINNSDFSAYETDSGIGEQFVAGADFKFAQRYSLGFEVRHVWFRANLSNISNGEVDLGGSMALMSFRMWF